MNIYYVAFDGDNAGDQVGQAVLDDDVAKLHEISRRIESGNQHMKQWVEDHGGQMISSGGDEGTFLMEGVSDEEEFLDHLESLRSEYSQVTDLSVTLGVGLSMSQAGKSLIAGKLLGKDMLVRYNPDEVDAILQDAHQHAEAGEGSEEEEKQNTAYLDHLMGDKDDQAGEEHHAEGYGDAAEGQEHEFDPEATMRRPDAGEDEGSAEEIDEDDGQEGEYHADMSGDGEESEEESEESGPSGIAYEEPMDRSDEEDLKDSHLPEDEIEEQSPEDIVGAIAAQGTGDFNEEEPVKIKGSSVEKEDPMAEDAAPSDAEVAQSMETDESDQALKGEVAQVLSKFKAQKEALLAIKAQSPELYGATLGMLEVMIAMSKRMFPASEQAPTEEQMAPEGLPTGPESTEAASSDITSEVPQDPKM